MSDQFKPPSWAGPAESGLHLDVIKDGQLVAKYSVDSKHYYLFGRNSEVVDFVIDHVSCSRVHAALVHHKALKRPFLLDLGSTHGTFVGNIRLEPQKPQQLFPDSSFHFGASTRQYILREKTKPKDKEVANKDKGSGRGVALPSSDQELETLTIYNTEQNCRLAELKVQEQPKGGPTKRKHVGFMDVEEIINMEDCDPSVGRFQNLVATEIIASNKKQKTRFEPRVATSLHRIAPPLAAAKGLDLYDDLPGSSTMLPNSAPDVDEHPHDPISNSVSEHEASHHKKYAKEIWPGKAPNLPHAVV
ncbi:nuclear inhibitor of protein phosphatase 1-like [Paramacrobiotus metropolitanus]|uniref:nuclear inhibitor of protein phosphatase 1-like n=1 Tax=Paramacrobiotus metropolitanus TaxID=2943436 RepID=UPI002445E41B|nr:nuclear inhibitor of protein phosphatase 1-like [Paramacrobiotus metropolitanus]